jgi:hypothetical protein
MNHRYILFVIVAAIILTVIVTIVCGEDNLVKYNKERNLAINGCVQCKLQELDRYYFYTCNGTEYGTSRVNWANLNASICK